MEPIFKTVLVSYTCFCVEHVLNCPWQGLEAIKFNNCNNISDIACLWIDAIAV